MSDYESLSHSKWNCSCHIVFIPKNRKKALYGKVRTFLGKVFHELARQRGSAIVRGRKKTSMVNDSGLVGMLFQQLVSRKKKYEITLKIKTIRCNRRRRRWTILIPGFSR